MRLRARSFSPSRRAHATGHRHVTFTCLYIRVLRSGNPAIPCPFTLGLQRGYLTLANPTNPSRSRDRVMLKDQVKTRYRARCTRSYCLEGLVYLLYTLYYVFMKVPVNVSLKTAADDQKQRKFDKQLRCLVICVGKKGMYSLIGAVYYYTFTL